MQWFIIKTLVWLEASAATVLLAGERGAFFFLFFISLTVNILKSFWPRGPDCATCRPCLKNLLFGVLLRGLSHLSSVVMFQLCTHKRRRHALPCVDPHPTPPHPLHHYWRHRLFRGTSAFPFGTRYIFSLVHAPPPHRSRFFFSPHSFSLFTRNQKKNKLKNGKLLHSLLKKTTKVYIFFKFIYFKFKAQCLFMSSHVCHLSVCQSVSAPRYSVRTWRHISHWTVCSLCPPPTAHVFPPLTPRHR